MKTTAERRCNDERERNDQPDQVHRPGLRMVLYYKVYECISKKRAGDVCPDLEGRQAPIANDQTREESCANFQRNPTESKAEIKTTKGRPPVILSIWTNSSCRHRPSSPENHPTNRPSPSLLIADGVPSRSSLLLSHFPPLPILLLVFRARDTS